MLPLAFTPHIYKNEWNNYTNDYDTVVYKIANLLFPLF